MVLCFVRVCIDKIRVFVKVAQSQWVPKDCLNAFTTALEAELRDPKGVATKTARGPRVVGVLFVSESSPCSIRILYNIILSSVQDVF